MGNKNLKIRKFPPAAKNASKVQYYCAYHLSLPANEPDTSIATSLFAHCLTELEQVCFQP